MNKKLIIVLYAVIVMQSIGIAIITHPFFAPRNSFTISTHSFYQLRVEMRSDNGEEKHTRMIGEDILTGTRSFDLRDANEIYIALKKR